MIDQSIANISHLWRSLYLFGFRGQNHRARRVVVRHFLPPTIAAMCGARRRRRRVALRFVKETMRDNPGLLCAAERYCEVISSRGPRSSWNIPHGDVIPPPGTKPLSIALRPINLASTITVHRSHPQPFISHSANPAQLGWECISPRAHRTDSVGWDSEEKRGGCPRHCIPRFSQESTFPERV